MDDPAKLGLRVRKSHPLTPWVGSLGLPWWLSRSRRTGEPAESDLPGGATPPSVTCRRLLAPSGVRAHNRHPSIAVSQGRAPRTPMTAALTRPALCPADAHLSATQRSSKRDDSSQGRDPGSSTGANWDRTRDAAAHINEWRSARAPPASGSPDRSRWLNSGGIATGAEVVTLSPAESVA